MIDFNRNNLDKSSSPYLQQHKNNPINWQEWSSEVLEYAKEKDKLIFVSIGYATCHWCHVMASEAFENKEIADYLNKRFVSIKIDREQRPDIDQYFMSFIQETQGTGGWPLNIILSPESKPFLAVTYIPITARHGMPGFLDLLEIAEDFYQKNKQNLKTYIPHSSIRENIEEERLIEVIMSAFDEENAGFGSMQKFPPHNTLLFLLHYFDKTKNSSVKNILEKTLDIIAMRGLHDHLQGGFYRYCVDSKWTIPHFEKMLYDQAMLLWVYSSAYKIFKKQEYKIIAEKIIKCLEETFEEDGLYYSAHDADTNHQEGDTYLWQIKDLKEIISKQELEKFINIYEISSKGNFEGKNHLIKKALINLEKIEEKLLIERKKRAQPFTDKKIITSWNALLGIAFIHAYRFANIDKAKEKSLEIFRNLLQKHYIDEKLFHSSLKGNIQNNEFLEDYASMLLFSTYIYEETSEHKKIIEKLLKKLNEFKKDDWYENKLNDFHQIKANEFDHPIPSSTSLAEMALLRANILLEKEFSTKSYRHPLNHDFLNLTVFIEDNFHIVHTTQKINWNKLPLNSIQIISKNIQDCYNKTCIKFDKIEDLLNFINQETKEQS